MLYYNEMNSIIEREEVKNKLKDIDSVDIVIGIPSYNNANTIGHVIRAVQGGLKKYFPQLKSLIINSDGGSKDGTPEVVENTELEDSTLILLKHRVSTFNKISISYHGIPGKGSAFRSIFEIASHLKAKYCAVVDSDLRSITPEWIELLIKPQMEEGFDFVAPLYLRHKFDGTITNSIIYPLTRCLYGKKIRQPIGGEFGFSGELAKFYLKQNVWDTDVARFGIDIWMTTTALANNFKVCQAFLGAKIHSPKDPSQDLTSMFFQVLSSTFDLMINYYSVWKEIKKVEETPTFGFKFSVGLEPVNINLEKMFQNYQLGVKELINIWGNFLNGELLNFLSNSKDLSLQDFIFPDDIWVDFVFSFALAYKNKVINREHLLKSFIPLYLGRTAFFVKDNWDSSSEEVERKIENLCKIFEDKKEYLIENWDKKIFRRKK